MKENNTFFGHPKGLAVLFFTELWERFSYYGMRTLLILFMVAGPERGGMNLDQSTAAAIYGLYTMGVYLFALPGGWLADRFLGLQKTVFYGGIVITLGHACLAIPNSQTFFFGLFLIVIGTGMLKSNISSLVGELYSSNDQARRDAGFSVFYMGINIGATVAPLLTGYIGERIDWHLGFAIAGVGMLIGVVVFHFNRKHLGSAGLEPGWKSEGEDNKGKKTFHPAVLWLMSLFVIVFVASLFTGYINFNPVLVAQIATYAIVASVILYFCYVFFFVSLTKDEKKKIKAILIFFAISTSFYIGYEQQGSTLNLFADRYTDKFVGSFEVPASWFQSLPAVFVILLAPVFAWLWVWLSKRNANPNTPTKLSLSLIVTGLGYLIMMGASMVYVSGTQPMGQWLVATYLFHTIGEILLYPVGLSAITKLSPKKLMGQMMGIWFMSLALGNLIAGLFAGQFDATAIESNPDLMVNLFGALVVFLVVAGLIVLLFKRRIRKFTLEVD
jgi:POT family proton-dependent oligopeptide transporter